MAKKSLRASLNQIRIWVRQGRTDAWIAHQLEVPTAQLRDFKRQHGLEEAGGEEEPAELELRDEIEAEVEAASQAEPEEEGEEEPAEDKPAEAEAQEEEAAEEEPEEEAREGAPEQEAEEAGAEEEAEQKPAAGEAESEKVEEGEERPRRRRRRRRRRRGGRRALEAVFDHGDRDGYGLWLDPAVKDDPVYAEHWAGQRELKVSIETDRIVLERAGGEESGD